MAATSKSPKKVLLVGYLIGKLALPDYAHKFSPKTYTQPQLFACLVLKEFLHRDYRVGRDGWHGPGVAARQRLLCAAQGKRQGFQAIADLQALPQGGNRLRLPKPSDPVDRPGAGTGIGRQPLSAGVRPSPATHPLRRLGRRCRLRRGTPSCVCSHPWSANPHPAAHRPTDCETTQRLLAPHNEAHPATLTLWPTMADRNYQQHAQTPARLRPPRSNLLVSMPRNRVARIDPEHHDPPTT